MGKRQKSRESLDSGRSVDGGMWCLLDEGLNESFSENETEVRRRGARYLKCRWRKALHRYTNK